MYAYTSEPFRFKCNFNGNPNIPVVHVFEIARVEATVQSMCYVYKSYVCIRKEYVQRSSAQAENKEKFMASGFVICHSRKVHLKIVRLSCGIVVLEKVEIQQKANQLVEFETNVIS